MSDPSQALSVWQCLQKIVGESQDTNEARFHLLKKLLWGKKRQLQTSEDRMYVTVYR